MSDRSQRPDAPTENKYDFKSIFEVLKEQWPIAEIKIRGLYNDFFALRAREQKLVQAIKPLESLVAATRAADCGFVQLEFLENALTEFRAALRDHP